MGPLLTPNSPVVEREERFRWSEVYRGVFNLQVWLTATAYFAILSGLYSFGLFVSSLNLELEDTNPILTWPFQLPTIINDLKITSNANETQLWSVIPYAVATPITGKYLPAFLPTSSLPQAAELLRHAANGLHTNNK